MFWGSRAERRTTPTTDVRATPDVQYMRELTIEELERGYHALPTSEHPYLFESTERILQKAVNDYYRVVSNQDPDPEQTAAATSHLNTVISQARELTYPAKVLSSMSGKFIDLALDNSRVIPVEVRLAAARVGTAIGGDTVPTKHRVNAIGNRIRSNHTEPLSGTDITLADFAGAIYTSLGVENVHPAATFADRMKNVKPVTLGGAVTALVTSAILAPNVANAAEIPTYATNPSNNTPNATGDTTQNSTIISVGNAPQTAPQAKAALSLKTSAEAVKPSASQIETITVPSAPAEMAKTPVTLKITAKDNLPKVDTTPQTLTVPSKPEAAAPAPLTLKTTDTISEAERKQRSEQTTLSAPAATTATRQFTSLDPATGKFIHTTLPQETPVALNLKASETLPEVDKTVTILTVPDNPLNALLDTSVKDTKLTPEQQQIANSAKQIKGFVIGNHIDAATTVILKNFHDKAIKATGFDAKNQPIYDISNKDLAANIDDLTAKFQALIKDKGHADANGVNMALMTFAVLKASAIDQSVLNSPDVKNLVSGAVKPTDEYQVKLYDQYAGTAKQTLEADNGKLLSGISDANKAQIEALYSYVLMAGVSDADQAKGIQAIKDAETAAAAAEAAKNAANNLTSSVDAEAINNVVSRHSGQMDSLDGASTDWRAFMAMQYIMAHSDYTPVQAAGIVGNLIGESSVMPSRNQVSGGVAKGIAQWEGERFDNLVNFAESRGKSWTDFETQLDFLLSELQGRGGDELKQATDLTSASKAFMYVFETPYVVVHGYDTGDWSGAEEELGRRSSLGQPILDAFNAEAVTVNAARAQAQAAAEAAAAKAAQDKQDLVSEENRFKDSTDVACSPNTPEVRNDTGYYKGNAVPIKLCALPNTTYDGSPGLVNARAAQLAFEMFSQMAKDLGLSVVTLNDAFRTMAQQEDAFAEYGPNQAAEPGYSNHQMGYAFDINMGSANGGNSSSYISGQDTSYPGNPVWEWLHAHAAEYHFYQYDQEGWHWSINGN